MKNNNQGLSLLEILLALSIISAITILGIKQYFVFKQHKNIVQVTKQVNDLLTASGKFYVANCISDRSSDAQYASAKQTLDTALQGVNIQTDLQAYLPIAVDRLVNPFGQFDNEQSYKVALIQAPFTPKDMTSGNWEQNDKTYHDNNYSTQGFDSNVLWQTQVKACITELVSKDSGESINPDAIRAYFKVDGYDLNDGSCTNGVVLTWTRLPRNVALAGSNNASARGASAQYNKMGQWSPWMKEQFGQDRFNYLCQT